MLLEGQYRADAVVGEGGFGVVYRGRHLSLDQPIAIKVLKGLDGGEEAVNALILEKFRTEARLLYTLSQSSLHIVRALDYGATTMPTGAWAPFMILEWLDGRSLSEDLDHRRRRGTRGRSLDEAFALLEPVADGLATAHRQQVAHRDVKPANIFLMRDEAGPRVKVLDFGIAKIMKEGESAGTKGTFASFTWPYATPEQLDPRLGKTGLRTDVYAFALILTELLTDRPPVDAHDVIGIMKAAAHPTLRPTPRTRGANVPDAIEAVCRRALAVQPEARYGSIDELWSALVSAREGEHGTSMQPVVRPSVLSRPQVPPPAALTSPATPSTTLIAAMSVPGSASRSPPAGPPPGSPPPGTWVAPSSMIGRPSHLGPPPSMVGPPPGWRA